MTVFISKRMFKIKFYDVIITKQVAHATNTMWTIPGILIIRWINLSIWNSIQKSVLFPLFVVGFHGSLPCGNEVNNTSFPQGKLLRSIPLIPLSCPSANGQKKPRLKFPESYCCNITELLATDRISYPHFFYVCTRFHPYFPTHTFLQIKDALCPCL